MATYSVEPENVAKDDFEREGIKFAHREVTVRLPDLPEDRQLTAEDKAAIGAAARRVGDTVEGEVVPAAVGDGR